MSYQQAQTSAVRVNPVGNRLSKHEFSEIVVDPAASPPEAGDLALPIEQLSERVRTARDAGASVILCYGAHLIKNGLGPVVADLVREGWITHLATNGAGVIHDWEYAFQGRSEEDVRTNVADGSFGAWDETGRYAMAALATGVLQGMGYGESIGRLVHEEGVSIPAVDVLHGRLNAWAQTPVADEAIGAIADLLHCIEVGSWPQGWTHIKHANPDASLTATAFATRTPLTVHPGIGYDIVYVHPQAQGSVFGRAAGIDFRVFCQSVDDLGESGVVISVGSAIMAPQVFEKAASVANNLRSQRDVDAIAPYIAVNDLQPATWDWAHGEPPVSDPAYYLRFLKSFARTSAEPLSYLAGDNRVVMHNLHRHLMHPTSS